jgi:hypothetical protein
VKPYLTARLIDKYEAPKYDLLLDQLHYLGSSKVSLTKSLRYVIENERGEWCALLDFGYAALKNTCLDKYLGWAENEKSKRLRYVLNNTRFLVIPEMKRRYKNLASRSLSLVTKRVSDDWEYYHGHHILVLETFVDESREGTCYKASNWLQLGETKGFGKKGGNYIEHGNKKKVFVLPLHRKAKEILSSKSFPHPILATETKSMLDINSIDLDDLESIFLDIQDPRANPRHGNTFPLSKLLLVSACAFLSGYTSFTAIGDYVKNLPSEAIAKLKFKKRPSLRPEESCIRKTLNQLDANVLQDRIYEWLKKKGISKKGCHIAIDGKAMRASIGENGRAVMNVSAVEVTTGATIASEQVEQKSNEIPAMRKLLDEIDIRGSVVSADAIHTNEETARKILQGGGNYILNVKDNQSLLLDDIIRLHEKDFSPSADHNK